MSNEATALSALMRAAARVSHDETFVAATFREWCGDTLDVDAVATELGCEASAVVRAALCTSPRAESFGADVQAIAKASGIAPERLIAFLREAASIAAFRSGNGGQLLAAARDNPEDGGEEPES